MKPFTAIQYSPLAEQKLRIGGYLTVTCIFFFFFMLEMVFSWQDENLYTKIFFLTLLHTLAMWEPTRLLILWARKNYSGLPLVKKRLFILAGVGVPYAVLIGFLRIFFEDRVNLWGVPIAHWGAYSYTIGITLLFVLLQIAVYESLYFFSEWNRSALEAEEVKRLNVEIQMASLKQQIEPHFLFNTLNTLIGLVEESQEKAVRFTQDLAYVYRYLLEANENTLIGLEDEILFAKRYFALLKTRYPQGLELRCQIADASRFSVPPLCLQTLIENAVKHNIISKTKPLRICITIDEETGYITVQNNSQARASVKSNGIGLRYLHKKFALLGLPAVQTAQNETAFIVRLPLLKKSVYESVDY
ncbi:MAG TPA: histidine kinase [Flavisolibacter sp.]|nr:histidine kinase [Flavisolibacter sp.]